MSLASRQHAALQRWEAALSHSQGAESSVQHGLRFVLIPRERSDGSLELTDRGIRIPLVWAALGLPFIGIAIYVLIVRNPALDDVGFAIMFFAFALVLALGGVCR